MDSPWLHRFAILAAVCTLLLIAIGACLTDYQGAGKFSAPLALEHRIAAIAVGVLLLGLWIWIAMSAPPRGLIRLVWAALAVYVAEGGLAVKTPILHALVSHILFALVVVIAVCTSKRWQRGPDPVKDQGWPSLRSLSSIALALVLLQVWLGAAFRHQGAGLMPHMVGAIVVAIVNLIICMFVMQQFPEHRALRPIANTLLAFTLVQVVLGIAALTTRMVSPDNSLPTPVLVATVVHVTVGALVLAGTAVLFVQIRRNVTAS